MSKTNKVFDNSTSREKLAQQRKTMKLNAMAEAQFKAQLEERVKCPECGEVAARVLFLFNCPKCKQHVSPGGI